MNDEIKEILDILKNCKDYDDEVFLIKQHSATLLLDCITNLQQENERLKEENKRIFSKVNDDELLISNAMNYAEAQDYKSRCEKAIEYIKKSIDISQPFYEYLFGDENGKVENLDKLLNILQNGSDEE